MDLLARTVGKPNAGSPEGNPAGAERSYVSVPVREDVKSMVKRPTRVALKLPGTQAWKNGGPFVTKASPTKRVGVVHVPPVITTQIGLKSLPDAVPASGSR